MSLLSQVFNVCFVELELLQNVNDWPCVLVLSFVRDLLMGVLVLEFHVVWLLS